jgi:hypothetical protein
MTPVRPGMMAGAVVLALALLLANTAEAASTLEFKAVPVAAEGRKGICGRVYAGPRSVMTIGGRGDRCPLDAQEVARRLNVLAEGGLRAGAIEARRDGRGYSIYTEDQRIVHIDRDLARFHRSSPEALAKMWAKNLREQFGRPYLSIPPLVVPLGETRSAQVKGNIALPVRVRAESGAVTASYDAAEEMVHVFGNWVGETELVVADERSVLRVPVRAAKWAGRLPAQLSARVTGRPAPQDTIGRAVKAATVDGLVLEPGAWASINPWVEQTPPLEPGQSAQVPVRVSAAGHEYLPYQVRRDVAVRNEPMRVGSADVLLVSNSPERLLSRGQWYEGTLGASQTARLLYHHVNATGASGDLIIELVNLAGEPGEVHVIAGKGGPSLDESWAGHRAGTEFLGRRAAGAGWVVPVRPGWASPILVQRMNAGSVASGVVELRALQGADFVVRCRLERPRSLWLPNELNAYHPSPMLGRWQYANPRVEIAARYRVGGDWTFVTIGDGAIAGGTDGERLAGNYGVIYEIALELINPTAESARVDVYLEPGGGVARGTLLVDGRLVEAALLTREAEAEVGRYRLGPGDMRMVHIETMPQGGSNYPVRLVARAR